MGTHPTIQAASIGIPDTLFLMLLALIVFGPRRLPEIGRQIGKLMYEFRKVSNDFKFQMEEELRASEEASRQQKMLESSSKAAAIEAPRESTPNQLGAGAAVLPEKAAFETSPVTAAIFESHAEAAVDSNSVEGEVRGEPRKFPPYPQPPATGEQIAAQKPFRGRVSEEPEPEPEPQQNFIAEGSSMAPDAPAATEQPSTGTEQEAHHG